MSMRQQNHFAVFVFLTISIVLSGVPLGAESSAWTIKSASPAPRMAAAGGVIDGRLYIAGGHDGANHGGLSVYDPATDTWAIKAPIPIPVTWAAAGVINGKLYVVSGCEISCSSITNQLQVYDPSSDSWSYGAPIPTPRQAPTAAAIADKLYVVGGTLSDFATQPNTLDVYDPTTDTWATKAPIPTPREGANTAVINRMLYIVGGFNRASNMLTNIVEAYDTATDTWTTKAPMPTIRARAGAGVIHGKLHVVGGYNSSTSISTHDIYDPLSNSWTSAAAMPSSRGALVADVIDSVLYASGGQLPTDPNTGVAPITGALEAYLPQTVPETCAPPPSGLVSWWDSDRVSGTTASDISDSNDGNMLGGVTTAAGLVGDAFDFNGSSALINVGNPDSLNFGSTDPFSIEAWFFWNGGGSSINNIIRKSNYPVFGAGAGYWLRIGSDAHTLEFFTGETTGSSGFPRGVIVTQVTPAAWHHVVGTRDNLGTMNLYLDGQLTGTTQAPNANTTSEAPFLIGAWDDRFGVIELFAGLIDEVSVYSRALTAAEVQAIYNAHSLGKCKVGGCTLVDNDPPTITIDEPTSRGYLLNESVAANYICSDACSGVGACIGSVPNGNPINTASVGTKSFTVSSMDNAGNSANRSVSYTVSYDSMALFDQTKAIRSGSVIPIKVQLTDTLGQNVSSAGVMLRAVGLFQVATSASEVVDDAGSANADLNFRFDSTIGNTGGYTFNLKTTGLTTGTYRLEFVADGDPTRHSVFFQVRQ
jgi:N-acetylneuraminic acid mutarotase